MKRLLKNFRFSWKITLVCLLLAPLMLWAARWQWQRYLYKKDLVQTYQLHSTTPPLEFPKNGQAAEDFEAVLNRRVALSGRYDYENQMIVRNRRHASGPGHWLLTPFKMDGTDRYVIVSRGFIPFVDSKPDDWEKYRFEDTEQLSGVVQETVPHRTFLSPRNPEPENNELVRVWLYPDIAKMAEQLPYPVLTHVYIQRVGKPAHGQFPAESVSIAVPPSTHFGYTIEWILLAVMTLVVGFLLQAFPRRRTTLMVERGSEKQVIEPLLHGPLLEDVNSQNGTYRNDPRSERE